MHKDTFSRFLLVAIVAVLLLAGCAPQSEAGNSSGSSNPVFNLFGSNGPTATPFQPGASEGQSAGPVFEGPLSVLIFSPEDNMVTSQNQVVITGTADSGTVISIDDEITSVGKDRQFNVTMQLVEGLNVFEITASDPDGNQDSAYLTVIYDPNEKE